MEELSLQGKRSVNLNFKPSKSGLKAHWQGIASLSGG